MREEWEEKKLGEVLTLEYGKPLPPIARKSGGKYAVYGANGIKARSDKFYVNAPSIIVGRKGSAGEITLTEDKFWPLDVTYFVTFDESKYDLQFIFYLLSLQELTKLAKGVKPGINRNEVYEKIVRVPSLPEQRRIVAILDEAFAGLATANANAEKNLKNARELFDSYLNSVFALKGEGWEATTLGSEVDLLVGFAFRSPQYTKSVDGTRLLRGDNVIQNALRWDDVKRWPATDIKNYENYNLEVGDVVLAMDRTWVKAGLKYAVIEKADVPCLLVQRVARLRCRNGLASRFLVHLIGGPQFTRYVLGIQTGLSVPHISGKQISDFVFWKPNLSEQQELGRTIDDLAFKVARLEEAYNEKLLAIEALKQSVLQKAFSGELTSPPSSAFKEAAE